MLKPVIAALIVIFAFVGALAIIGVPLSLVLLLACFGVVLLALMVWVGR